GAVVERLRATHPRAVRQRRVARDRRARRLVVFDPDLRLIGADVVQAARRARLASAAALADHALHDPCGAADVERAHPVASSLRTGSAWAVLVGADVLDRDWLDVWAL